jgi:hypothetical protein
MAAADKSAEDIDTTFTAPLIHDEGKGGWAMVIMPDSGAYFGTRKPVQVAGTMDGTPFRATLLPMGDGTHMVPINAALRKAVSKGNGDEVTVHLEQRFN